jgi:hypothetical protein
MFIVMKETGTIVVLHIPFSVFLRLGRYIHGLVAPIKLNLLRNTFFINFLAPIGAGGIHETFRFTSVSLSRAVGMTPWMRDQLIARPLPPQDNTIIE